MEDTFNFIQCCESGMIYSGTGYDILEFRFLPMVLSIFGNYKKYLITNQTEESTKYLSFFLLHGKHLPETQYSFLTAPKL